MTPCDLPRMDEILLFSNSFSQTPLYTGAFFRTYYPLPCLQIYHLVHFDAFVCMASYHYITFGGEEFVGTTMPSL